MEPLLCSSEGEGFSYEYEYIFATHKALVQNGHLARMDVRDEEFVEYRGIFHALPWLGLALMARE